MHRTLRMLTIPLLAAAAAVGTVGCGGDAEDAAAPSFEQAGGEAVYQRACASCHGADLEGTERGPSHLSIVYEPGHHPDESFRSAIRNGARAHHWNFGDMPAIADLTEAEVEAVIGYIRAEQRRRGFTPMG